MVLALVKTKLVTYFFFLHLKQILQRNYQNRVKQNKQIPPFRAENELSRRLLY